MTKKTDSRKIEDFICDTAILLAVPVKNIHTRRALLYKVSEDIPTVPYWTVKAIKCKENKLNSKKLKIPFHQALHLDHAVPRSVVTDWLCGVNFKPDVPVVIEHVQRAIELFRITCRVTGGKGEYYDGTEQQLLNKGTYDDSKLEIKRRMPPGWCWLHGDPWARYRYVRESVNESQLLVLNNQEIDLNSIEPDCQCSQDSPNRMR